jgi:hypothetical protein
VSEISAAVGGWLGVLAASLVLLCTIYLIAVLKMRKEAFCQAGKLDVRVGPK